MNRLPRLTPSTRNEQQEELFQLIAGGPRAQGPQYFELVGADGALNGPFNAMLYSADLGSAVQNLGASVRYQTALSPRMREMAILMVAAQWDSEFEQYAHEPIALAVGLTPAEITSLRDGVTLEWHDESEQAMYNLTRALCQGQGVISDEDFEDYRRVLGLPAIYEMSTLVGYYALLALQLRTFSIGIPR